MKKTLIIIGVLVVLVLLYGFTTYNKLVSLNTASDAQWKQVETEYQRRFDLIPNLVASVKGIMKQEQSVFDAIDTARTQYAGATTPEAQADAANNVESSLGRLLVITENYPVLQSSDTVQTLMAQLEGTENRISVERSRYNDDIQAYDLEVNQFPSSVVASMFGFAQRQYFTADAAASTSPQVSF